MPSVWLDTVFDGDEAAAQDGARTLRDLDLLRTQDSRNLQVVANIRGKPTRVYAIRGAIGEWKPVMAPNYGGYDHAGPSFIQALARPSPPSSPRSRTPPFKLETVVGVALDDMLRVLGMKLDPTSREFGVVMRAKTSIINTALNAQVRVGEGRLRQRQEDTRQRIRARIEQEYERRRQLGIE